MTLHSPSKAIAEATWRTQQLFQRTATEHGQVEAFQKVVMDFQRAGEDRSLMLEQISLPFFKQRANKPF